jgi:hypothetical protein
MTMRGVLQGKKRLLPTKIYRTNGGGGGGGNGGDSPFSFVFLFRLMRRARWNFTDVRCECARM